MKLTWIAAQVESAYYNGRVESDDRKLDFDDFLQMVRSANGDEMRDMWYDEHQRGNPTLYFATSIVTDRFEVKKKGRFCIAALPEGGAVKLPYAMGILRVEPVASVKEDDCEDYNSGDAFSRGEPGMETTFGDPDLMDDLGERIYIPIGNNLRLLGANDVPAVEVDYINNDEELDVPEGVAWRIFAKVLGPVLKVVGFPVDATDNANPNVQTYKQRLAEPAGL